MLCTRAAPKAATMTSEKLKEAIPIKSTAKFGDMVPVISGIRTFIVEANRATPRNTKKASRLVGDHRLAAKKSTPAPVARTRAIYVLAFVGIVNSLSDLAYLALLRVPERTVRVTPDHRVAPDDRVTPNHGVAPYNGIAPNNRIAPDNGVAPNHRVTPDNRVAPDGSRSCRKCDCIIAGIQHSCGRKRRTGGCWREVGIGEGGRCVHRAGADCENVLLDRIGNARPEVR